MNTKKESTNLVLSQIGREESGTLLDGLICTKNSRVKSQRERGFLSYWKRGILFSRVLREMSWRMKL